MDLFNALKGSPATLSGRLKNAIKWYSDRIKNLGKPSVALPAATPEEPFPYEKRPAITTPPPLPTPEELPSEEEVKEPEAEKKYFRKSTDVPTIGKMYFYTYDPKYKAVLPFYDMFPLVIPIHYYPNGFLGLNLHYLPPTERAALLMALFNLLNNNKFNETTAFNVTYSLLKNAATKYAGYENCVKRYLYGHIKSPIQEVYSTEWENVILLPLQRWVVNPNRRYSRNPPY